MRIPLSWLAEYVSLPDSATADSVMAELVKVGLEEEGSHDFDLTGPIVVGEVLEFVEEPQSNGKTIRWCQVRVAPDSVKAADGGLAVRGIVCGARNFFVGDKVVVTLPGAILPGDFKIAARSTYGHTSDGMIASAKELGLSDDHEGILRLSTLGLDPEVGVDALELLCLNDSAAEVNVTPDRGYCFSIRGIAREYSHATGVEFTDPISRVTPVKPEGFSVSIKDQAPIRGRSGVNKFVTLVVNEVDATAPTPAWMMSRLKLAGMRSISLVVDITNYVMLEYGQPIHAYDLDKLGKDFGVRRAKSGEAITTLDGQIRKLDVEDLVIVDATGPIGIAGVMGGASTEVSESTKSVLIEAANFDPISISRSARRHKLPSEASKRFERGVDTKVAEYAVARVAQLLVELAGAKVQTIGSYFDESTAQPTVFLPLGYAEKVTGVSYQPKEIEQTLVEIGCSVAVLDEGFEVIAPTWRPDLTIPAALVEEVARIRGYDQIPARLPVAPPGRGLTRKQKLRRLVANALAANGLTEVLNYPFLNSAQNSLFSSADSKRVKLANPLQSEVNELRLSLIPGLVEAAQRNLSRTMVDLSLFEIGSVYLPATSDESVVLPNGTTLPSANELQMLHDSVPRQPLMLGALMLGERLNQQVGRKAQKSSYADALSIIKTLAALVSVEVVFEQATPAGFHPGRSALVKVGERVIGFAGELHPEITAEFDLPRQVAVLEINLEEFFDCVPDTVSARPIHTYPAATQDLSLVVSKEVSAREILETIRQSAGDLLEEVVLVDDFRGGNLAETDKSLTFALRFRAADRTLTQAEASAARDLAVAEANRRFGATIRS